MNQSNYQRHVIVRTYKRCTRIRNMNILMEAAEARRNNPISPSFHSRRVSTSTDSCNYNSCLYSSKISKLALSHTQTHTSLCRHQRRFSQDAATTEATNTTTTTDAAPLTFQYAKAEEIFHKMTQLQRDELAIISNLINEKIGITITEADKLGGRFGSASASANGASRAQGSGDDDTAQKVEKTIFDLKLVSFDAKAKIKIIKEIRTITGLGLKEAKEMVEGAPKTIKKDIKLQEAEELKKTLEDVGAVIEVD